MLIFSLDPSIQRFMCAEVTKMFLGILYRKLYDIMNNYYSITWALILLKIIFSCINEKTAGINGIGARKIQSVSMSSLHCNGILLKNNKNVESEAKHPHKNLTWAMKIGRI